LGTLKVYTFGEHRNKQDAWRAQSTLFMLYVNFPKRSKGAAGQYIPRFISGNGDWLLAVANW